MNWQFENTGANSGVFNMVYDESLARALIEGTGNPTIRVYNWNPYAISLGWNQSINEINQTKAGTAGVDIVRRPTGGRAILHSEEITYSVVMRVKNKNILSVYDEISKALVEGLKYLGVDVSIEKSQPHFPSLYREASATACFSSAGRYEIKYNGKKLVGSAQRRYAASDGEEVVLQHGSILIGADHKRIVDFLNLSTSEQYEGLKKELNEKTIELKSILKKEITFETIAEAILFGFKKAWAINPKVIQNITNEQKAAV